MHLADVFIIVCCHTGYLTVKNITYLNPGDLQLILRIDAALTMMANTLVIVCFLVLFTLSASSQKQDDDPNQEHENITPLVITRSRSRALYKRTYKPDCSSFRWARFRKCPSD